jgi:hypothetical protein
VYLNPDACFVINDHTPKERFHARDFGDLTMPRATRYALLEERTLVAPLGCSYLDRWYIAPDAHYTTGSEKPSGSGTPLVILLRYNCTNIQGVSIRSKRDNEIQGAQRPIRVR